MPDGDIFSRTLSREWVKASRLAFGVRDDELAVSECLIALTNDLNRLPWENFRGVISLVVDAENRSDINIRRQINVELRRVDGDCRPDRIEAVRRVANRVLANGSVHSIVIPPSGIWSNREREIAVMVLVDVVIASISPACSVVSLQRGNRMSARDFVAREIELRAIVSRAPGMLDVADQLLWNPTGSIV